MLFDRGPAAGSRAPINTARLGLAALAGALLLAPRAAPAHAYDVGDLHIEHPWARTPPSGAPTAEAFLTVTNHGRTPDRLIGGVSPAVKAIEAHSMSMAGGVMRMRYLPDGFVIAPGATLTLAPGGDHLMLVGPRRALKAGERLPATLRFAHAGAVQVDFAVQDAPSARTSGMVMP